MNRDSQQLKIQALMVRVMDIDRRLNDLKEEVRTPLDKEIDANLVPIKDWLTDLCTKEPSGINWFVMEFTASFPRFNDWLREQQKQTHLKLVKH